MILEQHPLKNMTIDQLFPATRPFLKVLCCLRRRKNISLQDEKEALLHDKPDSQTKKPSSLKKKRSFVEKLRDKLRVNMYERKSKAHFSDPFIQYGYGVVAFFNLLKVLILMFIFFSLLVLPSIILYKNGSTSISDYFVQAQTTLGNLGSSYSSCIQVPLELDQLIISCKDKIVGEVSSFQIVPFHSDGNKRICSFQNQTRDDKCYDFYGVALKKEIIKECQDKHNCTISNIKSKLSNGKNKNCLDDQALVSVQVKCYLTVDNLRYNRFAGLLSVCIGIFICSIFLFVMYFGYQLNEIDFILWDLQTVTANDYTLDLVINEKILKEYSQYSENLPKTPDQNLSEHWEKFLKNYLEFQLQKYASENNKDFLLKENKLSILMLQFDFQQGNILKLLLQRGMHIKNLQFEKRRATEAKINQFIIRNQKALKTPVKCFVTFEHTDGLNLFLQMISFHLDPQKNITQQGLEAEHAPIPSNIIWQERNKTKQQKIMRKVYAFVLIFIVLTFFLMGIFMIRSFGSKGIAPFKKQKCNWIWQTYGDKLTKYSKFAFQESHDYFDNFLEIRVDQEDLNLVSCVCILEDDSIFYSGFRKKYHLKSDDVWETQEDPELKEMCNTFMDNYFWANVIYLSSSQTIVFLNFVLRYVIIMTVKFIGYETESFQTSRIMVFIFIVQFINTDLIILFMNADLSQTGAMFFEKFNHGIHPDFTVDWYKDIGLTLINAMVFNIYFPIIEFFGFYCLRLFWRQIDRGLCTFNSWKTKQITIEKYLDIYSGPEYTIHYKYSAILNITFITFMFGAGMPILFPIALASFIVLYVMERLLVAYSYKQPPMLDEKLNRVVIKIIMYAPILYCTFGFWMFNNIQIFRNQVGVQISANDNIQIDHTLKSAMKLHLSTPLFLMTGFFLIIRGTSRWTQGFIKKMINLDADISFFKLDQVSFISALNQDQRKWMIQEETKGREKFGIKKLSDEMLDKLETSPYNKETELIGVMTYQILDNPIYQKNFQYVPEVIDNREQYIFDDWALNSLGQSDYVKKNLNTFYLPENKEQKANQIQ